jgi:hypothetical protein
MAANQKKRQKKLERLAAKRKDRRRELVRQKNRGLGELLAVASAAPILHTRIAATLRENGLANVVISRSLPKDRVAVAVFLVDIYCLGVKDCFGRLCVRAEYDTLCKDLDKKFEMEDYSPADVRKLVEGSIAYARRLGFEPHPDYHRLKPIFGDIDPQQSKVEFEFGSGGKPLFVSGPSDGPERCRRIVSMLHDRCGPDGFHFMVGGPAAQVLRTLGEDDTDDDTDDEDDYDEDDFDEAPPRRLGF